MSELVFLFEAQAYDPVSSTVKNVQFSKGLLTEGDFADRTDPYPVRLEQAYYHETSIFESNSPGNTTVSVGSSAVKNADGRFDYLLDYNWDQRPVTIKRGFQGAAYATFTTEFVGSCIELTADTDNLIFTLRDNSYKLLKVMQPNKYAGSGAAEGGPDLREKRKPLLFGKARNIAPIWTDPVLLTMQVNDGAIASIDGIFDKGNPLSFHQNYTSYALLAAAVIPPGKYATSIETGFARLGAPPFGTLTIDATGMYNSATNLPEVLKQVLLNKAGLVSGDLNVPSFTQASLDAPQSFEGLYFPEPEMQVDEFLETIVGAFNGFWYSNRLGLITVSQFKFRTPSASIRAEDLMSLGKNNSPPPVYRVKADYAKNATVQGPSDFTIPRQTFNGFLEKKFINVDTSTAFPASVSGGTFKAYLNDTQINDLEEVQFRVRDGQSWITIDPLGVIVITDPGTSPATAVLRVNLGEFTIDETITVIKDAVAPLQSIALAFSADRFTYDEQGAASPSVQTITITSTGTNTTAPITLTAVDNLGTAVTVTGGTIPIANVSKSLLVSWVEVTATDANGVKQARRIMVQHGLDAVAAGILGSLAAANKAVTFFYQTTAPTFGVQIDDVWIDTDDANKMYHWTGLVWTLISDTRIVDALTAASGAQGTADGKIKTFFTETTPTATAVGDLWYKGTTKTLYRWSGTTWSDEVGTWGAQAGTNLTNSSGTVLGDANILNSAVSIGANGALAGAGGGTVTIGGLGFTGALDATKGATAGTDLRNSSLAVIGDALILNSAVSIGSNGALAGAGGGTVTIGGLGFTGELNADLTRWPDGPTQSTSFKYTYLGVAESGEFSRALTIKLMSPAGVVTSGVTWSYTVTQGTLNGFTSASGAQSMSVSSGVGTLTVSSLGSNFVSATIKGVAGGKDYIKTITLNKVFADAPQAGGGGGPVTLVTKTSGFTSFSSTTDVDVTGSLSATMPSGKTQADIAVQLDAMPASGATGNWTVRMYVTRDGVQVGSTSSAGSDWNSVDASGNPASLVFTINDTGRTAGATYIYRVWADLSTGTRSHTVTGTVTVTAP